MKKISIIYILCIGVICFTTKIQSSPQIQNESLYNQAIEQLSKQLEKTSFLPQEKRNLILKLTNYFKNESTPVINNKKTDVLYASIIQSYYKILKVSKSLAENFQERVIGKIWLHKNNFFVYEKRK